MNGPDNNAKSERNDSIRLVITTLLVISLFLSAVGASWSWFKPLMGNPEVENVTVETANLSIVYNGGPQYNVNNVLPGWSGTKTFTVTNNGEREATYNISWQNITNLFNGKNDIVYSITSTNGGGSLSETPFPSTGTNLPIISNITIPANTTQTYTVTMRFINRASEQNDQGSKLSGKIIINEGAVTPNTSRFVYVVSNETMNIGSPIPSGVNVRQIPEEAWDDWNAIPESESTQYVYLKHKLNGNDEIEESYVCFGNDNPSYCLKGYDSNAFLDNAKKTYDFFEGERCIGDNNMPTLYDINYTPNPGDSFHCNPSNIDVEVNNNGDVIIRDENGSAACVVYSSGDSMCGKL